MKSAVNNIQATESHLPLAWRRGFVKIDVDMVVEVVRLLAAVINVPHLCAPDEKSRALANFDAGSYGTVRSSNRYFKLVLPRIPDLEFIVRGFSGVDFPHESPLLGGTKLPCSVNSLVKIISGTVADSSPRCHAQYSV